MTRCRVCDWSLAEPAYEAAAPALTSVLATLDAPTRVFVCENCSHAQGDDIPEIQAFYDKGYRISLDGEDHDQVFAVKPDGTVIFRTDHQAEIALRLLDLPPGAAVLDYGAAKAATLRKMLKRRPDLRPHVFDVSSDYRAAWQGWLPDAAQAVYSVPACWLGSLDAVMSHFAIEHVAEPVDFIRRIGALLRPGGRLLISLPDVAENPGDMIVADHLSHFSEPSLRHALVRGGFQVASVDSLSFPGALFAVAIKDDAAALDKEAAKVAEAVRRARAICRSLQGTVAHIDAQAERLRGRKAAIYGAGFYGNWIRSRVRDAVDVLAFLDRNPHLQGSSAGDKLVVPPEAIPAETEALFVGLNPLKAREIIAAQPWLNRPGLQHIWLD